MPAHAASAPRPSTGCSSPPPSRCSSARGSSMPLVRISLVKGKPEAYRRKVGDAVHRALVEAVAVPPLDRFQLITEHEAGDLVYDSNYLGIARSADLVIVQITLSAGRSLSQ